MSINPDKVLAIHGLFEDLRTSIRNELGRLYAEHTRESQPMRDMLRWMEELNKVESLFHGWEKKAEVFMPTVPPTSDIG